MWNTEILGNFFGKRAYLSKVSEQKPEVLPLIGSEKGNRGWTLPLTSLLA